MISFALYMVVRSDHGLYEDHRLDPALRAVDGVQLNADAIVEFGGWLATSASQNEDRLQWLAGEVT